ncbi:hypothetical protein [Leptospira santarosai]|uniref:hypothetical protein n=1 Tax=Leptospira santarosai TaxID=28183 RepID=UPI0002BF7E89|nr:hypothetical protein [Leptospira santarosai]EMO12481.1 hypothetical protein LEP1GSC165_0046 [Leptospira santarosai str. CBC523]MDI7183599.1 hypothetical protein [Leptospira santarosai]
MKYLIYNTHGEYLNQILDDIEPDSLKPTHSSIEAGGEYREKLGEYGSVFVGDGKQSKRDFSLEFCYANSKPRDLDARIVFNEIGAFFSDPEEDGPYWIEDIDARSRARVMWSLIDPKFSEGLEYRISLESVLKFRLLDALWEDIVPLEEIYDLNNEDVREFSIPRHSVELKPILIIKALNPNPDFAIDIGRIDRETGEFRGNQSIRIQQINFNTNDTIVIDCVEGLALHQKVGSDLKSENKFMITAGGWMQIKRKDHAIRYQGTGSVELTLQFRPRYFI